MRIEDMACHTWALSGNPDNAVEVNKSFIELMNEIGARYGYGENLQGKDLATIREETMDRLLKLCETRTESLNNIVFLCAGFREGQVCPEHLWIEDHTTNQTYDTFINRGVVKIAGVGKLNEPFAPGCEEDNFEAEEIVRRQLNGYTTGQVSSINNGK